MDLRHPSANLVPRLFCPHIRISTFLLQFRQLLVQVSLFFEEMVSPYVCFEDRFKGGGVVADDFLLDEEDGDMWWDRDFTPCDVPEKGGFTNTVAADDTVATTVGEGKGGTREDAVGAEVDVDGGEVDVFGLVFCSCSCFEGVDLEVGDG